MKLEKNFQFPPNHSLHSGTGQAIFNFQLNFRRVILFLVLWQFFSVFMMAAFNWPQWVSWVNLGLIAAFILLFGVFESLLLLVASLPFYVVLPNPYFETLSMWRLLFIFLFLVWVVKDKKLRINEIKFLSWDKILAIFAGLAVAVTLIFAEFVGPGIKEIIYWLNAYIFYLVIAGVVKDRAQIIGFVKYTAASLLFMVALGFVQLVISFFADLDTFWVYWASFVSKVYYGATFADVAFYSNSWFSYDGARSLRLFSILPDSHAFALIAVFAVSFLMPLMLHDQKNKKAVSLLWKNVIFSALAIALAATRAVWVGVAGPIFSAAVLYLKKIQKNYLKKVFLSFALVIIFAAALPVFNLGFEFARSGTFSGEFNSRAIGIYNLEEPSNLGRLQIWKESLGASLANPFGVGLGNFVTAIYDPADNESYGQIISTKSEQFNLPYEYVTAHSLYLQILVELGLVSLGIFMIFIFKYFWDAWRFLKKYGGRQDFLVALVLQLSLALCWLFTSALFDLTLFNDRVLIYFFIALALSGIIMKNYETLK